MLKIKPIISWLYHSGKIELGHLSLQTKALHVRIHFASLPCRNESIKASIWAAALWMPAFLTQTLTRTPLCCIINLHGDPETWKFLSCVHSSNLTVKCLQDGCSLGRLLACTAMHTSIPVALKLTQCTTLTLLGLFWLLY